MKFVKYHGLGNDFIFIEDFEGKLLNKAPNLARDLCRRNFSIGADGLVLITFENDLYTMRIFNADGSEAEMCGNAIRCLGHYLLEKNLVEGSKFKVGTIKGSKEIEVQENLFRVNMGKPDFAFNEGAPLELHGFQVHPVSMGNPHGVIIVEDLASLDFFKWGPLLEKDAAWPFGANIEFVEVKNKREINVLVWERGVGKTLACGSGACASAVITNELGLTDGIVSVSLPGGILSIDWQTKEDVFMTGEATCVFQGVIK